MDQENDLVALLQDLVPEELTVTDLDGNDYRLPSRLSARRQIKALRLVEKAAQILDGIDVDEGAFESTESMIKAALSVINDDRIIDLLDEAFVACYPSVAKELKDDPSECFDVEDLVKAFGPLAMAFAKTMTKAGTLLTK